MLRILRGVPAVLPVAIQGEDGPLTLDAPPTVSLNALDGSVTASGAAGGSAGAYTFPVPPVARLGAYTATVAGALGGVALSATFPVEVVGGVLYSLPELRAFDAALSVERYADADVKRVRGYVDDEFTMITGRAFTPRAAVETLPVVAGRFFLRNFDPYRVVSATIDGVPVDGALFTFEASGLGAVAAADGTLVIEYEYGFQSVPEDVKRAAMLRGRTVLYDRDSGVPDRAMSFNVDGSQFMLATAGRSGFETGVPEVDATLNRYRAKPPGVA